jgi:hypothetical protein
MRALASLCLLVGLFILGCERDPSAAPPGGSSPSDREVNVTTPGGEVNVDIQGGGERRKRLRLPKVDVNIDHNAGGGANVDVNVERNGQD